MWPRLIFWGRCGQAALRGHCESWSSSRRCQILHLTHSSVLSPSWLQLGRFRQNLPTKSARVCNRSRPRCGVGRGSGCWRIRETVLHRPNMHLGAEGVSWDWEVQSLEPAAICPALALPDTLLCCPSCPPAVHRHRAAVHRGGSHQRGPGRERWAAKLLCLCCRVSYKSLVFFRGGAWEAGGCQGQPCPGAARHPQFSKRGFLTPCPVRAVRGERGPFPGSWGTVPSVSFYGPDLVLKSPVVHTCTNSLTRLSAHMKGLAGVGELETGAEL